MKHPVLSSAITGAAVMGAVGAAAYAMTSKNFKSQRRQMKRSLDKTVKSVGNLIDNISCLMK